MTNADLQQLFKVAYDKANSITSYPSFLPEEIDVWLNKAYSVLISKKFTGNNNRGVGFEGDSKRISDLQKLIKTTTLTTFNDVDHINNSITFDLTQISDFLFYITSVIKFNPDKTHEVQLVSHDAAKRSSQTSINIPWLPIPVAYLGDNKLNVYYDILEIPKKVTEQGAVHNVKNLTVTYVKVPKKIDISKPVEVVEISDNVCHELIDIAVYLALENIESQRVQTNKETLNFNE